MSDEVVWTFSDSRDPEDTHTVDSEVFETLPPFECNHEKISSYMAHGKAYNQCTMCSMPMRPTGWEPVVK